METISNYSSRGAAKLREWRYMLRHRYIFLWFETHFKFAVIGAVLLFIASIVANTLGTVYATEKASNAVTDIILSNTRVYNVGGIFVWGSVLLTLVAFYFGFQKINRMPFALKSVALFTLIRSVFVILTHIGPFPTRVAISSAFFSGRCTSYHLWPILWECE